MSEGESHAYFIGGHGFEFSYQGTFTVPRGVVIVVKMHSEESTQIPVRFRRAFCKLPIGILQDPLHHRGELVKAFGSLAFYTEGMQCPNFVYALFNFFPLNNYDEITYGETNFSHVSEYGSGIIPISDLQSDDTCDSSYVPRIYPVEEDTLENMHSAPDEYSLENIYRYVCRIILRSYRASIYPSFDDIWEYLHSEKNIKSITTNPTFTRYTDYSRESVVSKFNVVLTELRYAFRKTLVFLITQEDLIKKVREVRPRHPTLPDVYYNFVCRGGETPSILFGNTFNNNNAGFRPQERRSFNSILTLPSIKPLVTKHIGEAITARKGAIRNWNKLQNPNWYASHPAYQGGRAISASNYKRHKHTKKYNKRLRRSQTHKVRK